MRLTYAMFSIKEIFRYVVKCFNSELHFIIAHQVRTKLVENEARIMWVNTYLEWTIALGVARVDTKLQISLI